jgi:predicted nucleic acid-binding protein
MVVDASVAVKWFLAEKGSSKALGLRGGGGGLVAPSTVVFEIYHALWDAARRKRVPDSYLAEAVPLIPAPFTRLVPVEQLFDAAAELADELEHPIYDCAYLALARREDIEIVTADRDMARAGRRAKIKTQLL